MPKVQVKVIGSDDTSVHLRAKRTCAACSSPRDYEGWSPPSPERDTQYAFYRGNDITSGHSRRARPRANATPQSSRRRDQCDMNQSLDANLKVQNMSNSSARSSDSSSDTLQPADKRKGAAAGGFR